MDAHIAINASPARIPERVRLEGRHARLEPLNAAEHGDALYAGTHGAERNALWRHMADGPYPGRESFQAALIQKQESPDPLYFAIVERATGLAAGYAAYLRITPEHRVMEVGSIVYAPQLQRTAGATEAMYLMARYAFEDLGYRRYEWKCDARNEPSRRAALRLGFQFEGIFRQHMIVKGRNRDTAWYSMLDSEWPRRKAMFERWLAPENFDSNGHQIRPLERDAPR